MRRLLVGLVILLSLPVHAQVIPGSPFGGSSGGGSGTFTGGPLSTTTTMAADQCFAIGTNGGTVCQQTQGTPDQTGLWTGTTNNAWIIAEDADRTFDFAHASATDPSLYVHSHNQSTSQYVQITHNGSDAVIQSFTGFVRIIPGVAVPASGATTPTVYAQGNSTTGYSTGSGFNCRIIAGAATNCDGGTSFVFDSAMSVGFGTPSTLTLDAFFTRQAAQVIQLGVDAGTALAYTFKAGDSNTSAVAGANLTLAAGDGTSGNAAGGDLVLNGGNNSGSQPIGAVSIGGGRTGTNLKLDRTVTAGGTTGAQTINKIAGTVNFAAAATSIVVTDSTVNTSSIVFTTMRTADTTCTFVKSVVPAAGSFTITVNAGCAAETSVGFLVTN